MSEIRIMAFNFPPKGWAMCNGQFLPINQNQALFSLLGTTYGGNGQTTFALPDLRGRTPIHLGAGFIQGQAGGQEVHTLTQSEMPAHNHFVVDNNTVVNSDSGTGRVFGRAAGNVYGPAQNLTPMGPQSISSVGGSQAHENRQPYTVLNMCIALVGVFPSRN